MGRFEALVEELDEARPSGDWRSRVLRAVSEALDPDERKLFERLARAWLAFRPVLDDSSLRDKTLWRRGGKEVIEAARDLAFFVLRTRKPPSRVRDFTSVAKTFTRIKRQPRNVRRWFDQNREGLRLLLQAKDWEEIDPGIDVGDFTIFDTARRGGVEDIVKLVKAVSRQIRTVRLPRVEDILYGDVFVTGDMTGGLAFYRSKQDTVWIRPRTKWGRASEHALTHELGHRYWQRFLTTARKGEWIEWDRELRLIVKFSTATPEFDFPEVGEPLPMVLKGFGPRPPVVRRIEQIGDDTRFYVNNDRFVTDDQIRRFYRKQAEDTQFPTLYARRAQDPEEHFCEAFSLYVWDKLEDLHLTKFEEIMR